MELNRDLDTVIRKVEKNPNLKDFPHITKDGGWITTEDGYWTGGFWVGLLWHAYKITGDEKYNDAAYKWAKRLESGKNDNRCNDGIAFAVVGL